MTLFPLDYPPGVYRNGTNYQSMGRFYEAALVRWHEGTLRPFGGWVQASATNLGGPGRGILTWRPSNFNQNAAIGTPDGLFVYTSSGNIFDITPVAFTPGRINTIPGSGYGAGPYGAGLYGSGEGATVQEATTWTMDTWGDYLAAVASHDGVIVEWTGNTGTPAAPVANAPTARSLFVTDERILVAVGADGDLRKLQWCSNENNTLWTPAANNQAGDHLLQSTGTLVRGARTRDVNLIWTTTDLHRMAYIGLPYVYSISKVSDNCGLVSANAVQIFDGQAMWLGWKNFYFYDGGTVRTLDCDIHDYIFSDINFLQAAKFSSGYIAATGEVLFSYCSAGSTSIDRCVSYNHRENHWNIVDPTGLMPRGCWADVGAFRNPLAVGEDGLLYVHESGWTANGTPLLDARYALAGPVQLGNGDRVMEVTQMLPDEIDGSLSFYFDEQFTPTGTTYTKGPYPSAPYTDVRLTARQLAMKIVSGADEDFRVGKIRLEARPGSRR